MKTAPIYQSTSDRLAILASGLCVFHCVMTPILLAILPALASASELLHSAELLLIGIMLPISVFALFRGYRCHCSLKPTLNALGGVALLALARFVLESETGELVASTLGGLCLIAAHIYNIRQGKHCASGKSCKSD